MGERGVWFLVVLGSLLVSFLLANKTVAGSRSMVSLPQTFLPHLRSNEAEGASEGAGVSYTGTSLLVPWRGFSSEFLAPMFLSISCWNKFELDGCCSLCPLLSLAMVAEKEILGGILLPILVKFCPSSIRLCRRGGGRAKGELGSCAPWEDKAATTDGVHDFNQFVGDNLVQLKVLHISSFLQDLGSSGTNGKTMGMVLMHLIQGLSKLLQVNLYLHTRVRCTTCCAAPGSCFFDSSTTAVMPVCWRPLGSAGCNLMKLSKDDVGMLICSCLGSTPVLLNIQWRPRALRLVSAYQLPMLRMVQPRCCTSYIMQVAVHAAYSIFMSLELIRRKRVRAFPLSLLRFSGEDILVLSSVMPLFDLQLNPLPRSSHPTRLLVEPLALRLETSQKAPGECGCRFFESEFSPDTLAGSDCILLFRLCGSSATSLSCVLLDTRCLGSGFQSTNIWFDLCCNTVQY